MAAERTKSQNKQMDLIQSTLKDLIDRNGFSFLEGSPDAVWKAVPQKSASQKRLARLLLVTLLAGIPSKVRKEKPTEAELSEYIHTECGIAQDYAGLFARMYEALFSPENEKEWDAKSNAGFEEFCSTPWDFDWDGDAVFHYKKNYAVMHDCTYHVSAELHVADRKKVEKEAAALLRANPFLTAEELQEHFDSILSGELDSDFSDYCEEDYYPPVIEDYDCEDILQDFCKEYGFAYEGYEGGGELGDYEQEGGW